MTDHIERFNKSIKRISGDGQSIKEILDTFNEVLEEKQKAENELSRFKEETEKRFDTIVHKIEEDYKNKVNEAVEEEYKKKVAILRRTIWAGIKKYIDEEMAKLVDNEDKEN